MDKPLKKKVIRKVARRRKKVVKRQEPVIGPCPSHLASYIELNHEFITDSLCELGDEQIVYEHNRGIENAYGYDDFIESAAEEARSSGEFVAIGDSYYSQKEIQELRDNNSVVETKLLVRKILELESDVIDRQQLLKLFGCC